jgi:putative NADH-flavin reductase
MAPLVVRNEVADHEAKEAIIRQSKLDWTIVRPVLLTNGPHTGVYRNGVDIRVRSFIPTISRADVAEFMLTQLADKTYVRKTVAVMH